MRRENGLTGGRSLGEARACGRRWLPICSIAFGVLSCVVIPAGRGAEVAASDDARVLALASGDESAVRVAAEALVQAGPAAIPDLVELLDTGSPDPAGMAWKTLFRIVQQADTAERRQAIARVLFEQFEARPAAATRNRLIELLSFVGNEETVDGLYRYLGYPDVQEMVRWALVRIPASNATQALVAGMQITEWDFRIAIVHALGERGDPRAAPALRMLAGSDDESMSQAAMRALARLPDRVSVFVLGHEWEAGRPGATRMLLRLTETLTDAGRTEEARSLLRLLAKSSNTSAIEFCAVASGLGRVGDVGDIPQLLAALDDTARWGRHDARVRSVILPALERIDVPAAREGCITLWWLAGPVPMPEDSPRQDCDLDPAAVTTTAPAELAGKAHAWRRHHTADPGGKVHVENAGGGADPGLLYAYTEVLAEEDLEARMRLAGDAVLAIWLNGARIDIEQGGRDAAGSKHATVRLAAGVNRVLVKVAIAGEDGSFGVRLLAPEGGPAPVRQRWW